MVAEASVETIVEELSTAVMAGDRRALARVLTAVENRTGLAEPLLRRLYPLAGRAHLVGITGPPGSGTRGSKSSTRDSGRPPK